MDAVDLIRPRRFVITHIAPERYIITEEIMGRSKWINWLFGVSLIGTSISYEFAVQRLEVWKGQLLAQAAEDIRMRAFKKCDVYTETWPKRSVIS